MITAHYTGNDKLKSVCVGNEKQISAMLAALPEGTTVTIEPRYVEEKETETFQRLYPNGKEFVTTRGECVTLFGIDDTGKNIPGTVSWTKSIQRILENKWSNDTFVDAPQWQELKAELKSKRTSCVWLDNSYHVVSPDGFNVWFSCNEWTIVQNNEPPRGKKAKKNTAPVVSVPVPSVSVSVPVVEAERPVQQHQDATEEPETETQETVSVPSVPVSIAHPIPTKRERYTAIAMGISKKLSISGSRYCVWVGGETYPHRNALKANGFKWSPNKKMWWVDITETETQEV
jgi:hypothetical protein